MIRFFTAIMTSASGPSIDQEVRQVRTERHVSMTWRTDDKFFKFYREEHDPFFQITHIPLRNVMGRLPNYARLDADRTAKGKTSLVVHMHPDWCFYGVGPHHDPALRNNETGEKTPLYR